MQNHDNKRNEYIICKISNRGLVINSSIVNLFNVERIKHIFILWFIVILDQISYRLSMDPLSYIILLD